MVDLDDKSLILFNYTMEDLTNPTIVKNAFSHQVTIKGTPNNNQLFGDIFRLDREVTYNGGFLGTDFNPSRKTPFVIYNELNEVLESGYCKLDSVTKTKGVVEYKVSLYGGLGSFIYSLAYDSEGNKRTLADLDYLGTGNTETELNFMQPMSKLHGMHLVMRAVSIASGKSSTSLQLTMAFRMVTSLQTRLSLFPPMWDCETQLTDILSRMVMPW